MDLADIFLAKPPICIPSLATARIDSATILCRRPNPFRRIVHHQIEKIIVDCSPLCESAWKYKEYIKVLGTQLLQDMVASQQIGILSLLVLRDPQIFLIIGIVRKKCTGEALQSIQDVIISLCRGKS